MDDKNEQEAIHREVEINMPQVSLVGHSLTQIGTMLVCHSCPYEHSYFIPPNMIYQGNNAQGFPMLEKVK